jgi:hypothetical protein
MTTSVAAVVVVQVAARTVQAAVLAPIPVEMAISEREVAPEAVRVGRAMKRQAIIQPDVAREEHPEAASGLTWFENKVRQGESLPFAPTPRLARCKG